MESDKGVLTKTLTAYELGLRHGAFNSTLNSMAYLYAGVAFGFIAGVFAGAILGL